MLIGYARVSTKDQNLQIQIKELQKAGCERIFEEKESALKHRPELDKMINHVRRGDTVVVWKLDRLGRSLNHLIQLVNNFREKGVEFKCLDDMIDTGSSHGRLIFNIFASFAEFERELIRERTIAGLNAAKEKGRFGGRKRGLSEDAKKTAYAAYHLSIKKENSVSDILQILKISKATYYRYISFARMGT